ncbi:hypothetical protein ID866_11725 [Astraeus odoratus]|nr:hypothetical protein ID866_11725 [Astraeus odoratus]
MARHAFHDIWNKGAIRNFSTQPNEKQHSPIKYAYLHQTNQKDIANQVCQLSLCCVLGTSPLNIASETGPYKPCI